MIRRLAALAAVTAASCGQATQEPTGIQNLERPVDIAFSCYGNTRITGGDGAQATDPLEYQPQPVASCTQRTGPALTVETGDDPDNAPAGQEDLAGQPPLGPSMRWFMFAVQSAAGTVAVIEASVIGNGGGYTASEFLQVRDGDELVPGKNALSVGSLPVAIAGDPSGCYMVTANAGSCDLSVIDVARVVERSTEPLVVRRAVTTAAGAPLLARPAAMIADTRDAEIGVACPAEPQGYLYVAYPECHAVAVVDAATGAAAASIRFDAAGTATIGDGNLSCPAECGVPEPTVDGGRPVTLELVRDDRDNKRRLAIGLDNRPVVTVVDLDTGYLPTVVEQYELEGAVGVVDVAITREIGMTGTNMWTDETALGRGAQFVYAVATDGTVRVVEISNRDHECDTQIDPRFLRTTSDPLELVCIEPGQVGTPPRRAGARGPGIELPGDDAPLSVAVSTGHEPQAGDSTTALEPAPTTLLGHFAFVTSTRGLTYVVNIDDDNYADRFLGSAPLTTQLPLAMPHQLRDANSQRDDEATVDDAFDCDYAGPETSVGGPRAEQLPTRSTGSARIGDAKIDQLPSLRALRCEDATRVRARPEVMYANSPALRADVFPDLRAVPSGQTWQFEWEGSLSLDGGDAAVDGPRVRAGQVRVGDGAMRVSDAARPYCAAGVERFDYVQLRGCDPAQGDRQCGLGETCYVHPDATVASGACLPTAQVNELASVCRDYLISVRRYAVQQSTAGELVLSERRRVLRTTPVTGCTSTAQCEELALYDAQLTSSAHPSQDTTEAPDRTWTCGPDPTRAPGIDRCQMTCVDSSDCDDGTVCSGGYCLEGTIPAPECVAGLQLYSLHASGAFTAVGSVSGYLHPIVEGAGGQCVKDPAASPLLLGRVPLTAPPCTGDDVDDLLPNPCSVQVEHTVEVPVYSDLATCTQPATGGSTMRTGMVDAIRFRNPSMTLHLANPTYPGDAQCLGDRAGTRVGIPVVAPGFAFRFSIVAGFSPQVARGMVGVFPTRIVRSPDGVLWIVDEGDLLPQVADTNTRGQIFRFDPDNFDGVVIR